MPVECGRFFKTLCSFGLENMAVKTIYEIKDLYLKTYHSESENVEIENLDGLIANMYKALSIGIINKSYESLNSHAKDEIKNLIIRHLFKISSKYGKGIQYQRDYFEGCYSSLQDAADSPFNHSLSEQVTLIFPKELYCNQKALCQQLAIALNRKYPSVYITADTPADPVYAEVRKQARFLRQWRDSMFPLVPDEILCEIASKAAPLSTKYTYSETELNKIARDNLSKPALTR